jgi:hypothetical protein
MISHHSQVLGSQTLHRLLRSIIVNYIERNWEDFGPFLEEHTKESYVASMLQVPAINRSDILVTIMD